MSKTKVRAKGLQERGTAKEVTLSAGDGQGGTTATKEKRTDKFAGVGRNQMCPCGSGRKFKACHGKVGQAS